ncbi:class I SAM-dependent methyltransferase [Microvirga flavescens]|uniref:class I SAM-dependent methyltransferase n=1 Tax=Microvirga flavescens TaxID=2249811 RepID=UPI00130066BB|nr:class I SAM-dependent methyltransferase [Microvirga flavescens]
MAARVRRRMFLTFMEAFHPDRDATLLDVGATSDTSYESSNYLEALYPHKDRITACGVDDASHLETLYPGVKFVPADGLNLPFADRSFDYVHSSAVLEHVGSAENQARFVTECARVARRGFFLTTPNRWFPIDYHTQFPLLHWLPKPWHRAALTKFGHPFFAKEENLNLMTASELRSIGEELTGFRVRLETATLLGWPSNLLLIGERVDV